MIKSKKDKHDTDSVNEELKDSAKQSNDDSPQKDTTKALQQQVEHYKDLLLRKAAEFENYKRRTESEISNLYRYANEGLILELLPVVDDFTRLKKSFDQDHDLESFKKGMELVYEKLHKVLAKQGLKEIDALNKPFDVNYHEAVMQVPDDSVEPNTVTGVIESGYNLKDKVLRHAKVIVSSIAKDDEGKE